MFTPQELQLFRQSLDVIQIMGKDAKLVAEAQEKLEILIIESTPQQEKPEKPKK